MTCRQPPKATSPASSETSSPCSERRTATRCWPPSTSSTTRTSSNEPTPSSPPSAVDRCPATGPGPPNRWTSSSSGSTWASPPSSPGDFVKLNVNGAEVEIDDRFADSPLLWVLRDVLELRGTKYG